MDPQVVRNADADSFPMPHTRAVPFVTGADTGGAWEALELTLQPGAASPPHTLAADKVFYMADGELDVDLDGATHGLAAGGLSPAVTPLTGVDRRWGTLPG